MSTTRQCRTCGTEVPTSAPFGHCPKCLIDLGFGPLPDDLPPTETSDGNQRFGDYELIEQIGRGGMGIVYRARQIALNRIVALKMISAGEFASTTLIHRFHREAEAAANLHHPHIVPIYEIGELRGQHFYSMQLVEGTGLDKHISRSGFTRGPAGADVRTGPLARQEDIARILATVARAVDYAHRHGVLHRDLKPGNILLDARGEPHLTDFGVAKVLGHDASNLTASGAIMGTPSFMAPEQAAGDSKHITVAADIYSLGAVLYTMLTGSPPFRAETPVETLKQVIEQEPKHPSTIREGLDFDLATIAMKCLEKEPQRRYASAVALAEDLERWLQDEPIQARPVHNAERFWRWCRRNPKEAALGASVAFLLLCLTAGALIFATRVNRLNQSLEFRKGNLFKAVVQHLVKVYADPKSEEYPIDSDMRRTLFDEVPRRLPLEDVTNIIFVEDLYEHPTNTLITLAPILTWLEEELTDRLKRPVAIQLKVCKSLDTYSQTMDSTNSVFTRMGPSGYTLRRQTNTSYRLIAMQDHKNPLTMALFTRTNSEVSRLYTANPDILLRESLTGRSLALSRVTSTTGNNVPKWFLSSNGVFASTLSRYTNCDGQRRVFDSVLHGAWDVGSGNIELLNRYPELHVIATHVVPDLGRCWVAGQGMSPTMENALRAALLKLRDPKVLAGLESETIGFKMLNDEGFSRLRAIMRGADAFDFQSNMPVQ